MKKITLWLMLSQLLILISCRKDLIDYLTGGSDNKKFTVNFRIGGLNHNVGEPNAGFQTEPIQNYITQLSVIAYHAQRGEEVARQTQVSTDPNYGQILFSLPGGDYIFVAAGSKTLFGINRFYEPQGATPIKLLYCEAYLQYLSASPFEGDKKYSTSDTFLATDTVNIKSNKTVDMIMQRQIGRVEVSFDDAPEFLVTPYRESTAITFNTRIPMFGVTLRPQILVNTAVDGPFKLDLLTTEREMWLEIDPPGKLPIDVFLTIKKNRVTKVTGSLLNEQIIITDQ